MPRKSSLKWLGRPTVATRATTGLVLDASLVKTQRELQGLKVALKAAIAAYTSWGAVKSDALVLPSLSIWARSNSFPAGDAAAATLHASTAHLAALAKLQLSCRAAASNDFVRLAKAAKRSVKRGLASIAAYIDAEAEVERFEQQAREVTTAADASAAAVVAVQQQVAEAEARMQGARAVAAQVAQASRLQAESAEVRGALVALRKCHARHARQVAELLQETQLKQAVVHYRPRDGGHGLLETKAAYSPLPPAAVAAAHRLQQVTAAEGWLNAAISHCAAAKKRVAAFAREVHCRRSNP